jgi:hypothetical protein
MALPDRKLGDPRGERYEAKLTRDALAMASTFVIAPPWS